MEESGSCLICFMSITAAMMAIKGVKLALDNLAERIVGGH
jgi:hypothetical protein